MLRRFPTTAFLTTVLLAGLGTLLGLAGGVLLTSNPARAQVTVEPQSLSVTVPQHESETRTVTLTNAGGETVSFCLSFERPLQQTAGELRLAEGTLGGEEACGGYGEVLALIDRDDVPEIWDPYGLTTTPDGRLFAADSNRDRTYELTPELTYVRSFFHPAVAELEPFPATLGVAYDAEGTGGEETLWWLNVEDSGFDVLRALLIESDLEGVPTGRTIELPVAKTAPPPYTTGRPVGLTYDASTEAFYYVDIANDDLWAVDTEGEVLDAYPIRPAAYPGSTLFWGLNTLPSTLIGQEPNDSIGQAEGLRLELYINPPGTSPPRHLGVIGPLGEDTAPDGVEPLETPLPDPLPGTGGGTMSGAPVRSVLDPNGVLYYPYSGFDVVGVVAIRPHPLPPSWLVVEAWRGTLAPDESRDIALTFRPGSRAVGEYTYTSALQVFEAESGKVVEVPLSLRVTEGTVAAEVEGEVPETTRLSVWPNPFGGETDAATVSLVLSEAADVVATVFDVLGREVAVLHDGRMEAGEHRLALDGRTLPAGVYVVRAEAGGLHLSRRFTLVR
jgi:hypothetical protein